MTLQAQLLAHRLAQLLAHRLAQRLAQPLATFQRSTLVPRMGRALAVMAEMVAKMVMMEMDTIRVQTDNPFEGGAKMTQEGAFST